MTPSEDTRYRWHKLGKVYTANSPSGWARSHAYIPTSILRDEKTIRVFCAFLDENKIGRIGFVDVCSGDPTHVLCVSDSPALDIGKPGAFDDHGVTPLSV